MPRSRWYTDADPIADEQRRAEARQLREAESNRASQSSNPVNINSAAETQFSSVCLSILLHGSDLYA